MTPPQALITPKGELGTQQASHLVPQQKGSTFLSKSYLSSPGLQGPVKTSIHSGFSSPKSKPIHLPVLEFRSLSWLGWTLRVSESQFNVSWERLLIKNTVSYPSCWLYTAIHVLTINYIPCLDPDIWHFSYGDLRRTFCRHMHLRQLNLSLSQSNHFFSTLTFVHDVLKHFWFGLSCCLESRNTQIGCLALTLRNNFFFAFTFSSNYCPGVMHNSLTVFCLAKGLLGRSLRNDT